MARVRVFLDEDEIDRIEFLSEEIKRFITRGLSEYVEENSKKGKELLMKRKKFHAYCADIQDILENKKRFL